MDVVIELVGAVVEMAVMLVDHDRRPEEQRLEECLRCGAMHAGAKCPACGYVFRVRPDPLPRREREEEPND